VSANRVVIVTGGSSGMGLATAVAFAARGDDVAIVARNPERLAAAAERIREAAVSPNQRVAHKSADLSDFSATETAFAELASEGFVPDVLVNSAGVIYPGEFVSMPLENFEINIDHGFWSVVYPCRAVAPGMVAQPVSISI